MFHMPKLFCNKIYNSEIIIVNDRLKLYLLCNNYAFKAYHITPAKKLIVFR